MTKQIFESFAADIRASDQDEIAKWFAVRIICRTAEKYNPRCFDRARFVRACGLVDG